MSGSKAALLTLAMAGGLAVLAIALRGPYARLAAEHWQRQLGTADEDQARDLLAQAAALGEPGIAVLVEALGSERPCVAQAGKEVLGEQLTRWQGLSGADSARGQAVLADTLAASVGGFGPSARQEAAQLAARILHQLPEQGSVDRAAVIAACERVLQAAAEHPPQIAEKRIQTPQAPAPAEASAAIADREPPGGRWAADAAVSPERALLELSRLPGGGLPVGGFSSETTGQLEPTESAAKPPATGKPAGTPRAFSMPSDARPIGSSPSLPRLLPDGAKRGGTAHDADEPGYSSRGRGHSARPMAAARAGGPAEHVPTAAPPAAASRSETVELMRQLQAADQATAASARAELMRRHFTAAEIEVARRLFDPDPEVRRQLAQALPSQAGIDPAPWLLWLCRDQDAQVRLIAVTLLATSSDPSVLREIEALARDDADPRVRQRAERLGREKGSVLRF